MSEKSAKPLPIDFITFTNTINGEPRGTPTTRNGINPATLEDLPPVPVSTVEDINEAIKAARHAFPAWRETPMSERGACLVELSSQILAHKTEFAELLTREQGKPLASAEREVLSSINSLTGTAALQLPEDIIQDTPERLVKTTYIPIGVIVGIVPWNFENELTTTVPILLLCGKLAPAVYTGSCIILKPSPFTPYSGLKLVQLAQRCFPPGVIQILSGDDSLGPLLTARPDINLISFTGSIPTGKLVMASASKNLTRVILELGGNDPAIICPDVDIPSVARKIAQFAFVNSGQVCIAIKRIHLHQDIYRPFRDALIPIIEAFKVGPGTDKDVTVGPIQNQAQYKRVEAFLHESHAQGHTIATGGQVIETASKGFFIQPTLIDCPPEQSRIVTEEPFGPIVPLLTWSAEEDVIQRANNGFMGLGASVWSPDIEKATRIANALEAGTVWINEHMSVGPDRVFTGHKQSGMGVAWGVDGLKALSSAKTLVVNRGFLS